jgi:hypothetical protein
METRQPGGIKTRIKTWLEERAIRRCLAIVPSVDGGVFDAPCGPGRLFPVWKSIGIPVFGMDYSRDFAEFAAEWHKQLGLEGWVRQGDAFSTQTLGALFSAAPPSVAASVRFIYYFKPERRLSFLRGLRLLGARYVLTQYVVSDSPRVVFDRFKGWLTRSRRVPKKSHQRRHRTTLREIRTEFRSAGLRLLVAVPASPFSDRWFVLGKFRGMDPAPAT